ncbi:MAG: hypothetical protein WAV52_13070 [Luteococcus japonicus]
MKNVLRRRIWGTREELRITIVVWIESRDGVAQIGAVASVRELAHKDEGSGDQVSLDTVRLVDSSKEITPATARVARLPIGDWPTGRLPRRRIAHDTNPEPVAVFLLPWRRESSAVYDGIGEAIWHVSSTYPVIALTKAVLTRSKTWSG